jgi:hypothetical protein
MPDAGGQINTPPGAPGVTYAAQGAAGEAAEAEARAAFDQAQSNAQLGQQAAAAGMAGQDGFG